MDFTTNLDTVLQQAEELTLPQQTAIMKHADLALLYEGIHNKLHPSKKRISLFADSDDILGTLANLIEDAGLSIEQIPNFLTFAFTSKFSSNHYFVDNAYKVAFMVRDFESLIAKFFAETETYEFDPTKAKKRLQHVEPAAWTPQDWYEYYLLQLQINNFEIKPKYWRTETKTIAALVEKMKETLKPEDIKRFMEWRFENAAETNFIKADWLIESGFDDTDYLAEFMESVFNKQKRSNKDIGAMVEEFPQLMEFGKQMVIPHLNVCQAIGTDAFILCLHHLANEGKVSSQFKDLSKCIEYLFSQLTVFTECNAKNFQRLYRMAKAKAPRIQMADVVADYFDSLGEQNQKADYRIYRDWCFAYECLRWAKTLDGNLARKSAYVWSGEASVQTNASGKLEF